MYCKLLWIKASAKCINVNLNITLMQYITHVSLLLCRWLGSQKLPLKITRKASRTHTTASGECSRSINQGLVFQMTFLSFLSLSRRCQTKPVCSDLQSQILKCYAENKGQTMSCSSAASLYIQCVDRARQVNYTPRDMSLIRNTDWEKDILNKL